MLKKGHKIDNMPVYSWRQMPLNVIKGMIVGLGAILPGISGGVLCVILGVYKPLMQFFAHPFSSFYFYSPIILPFLLGLAGSFVGLSGAVNYLFSLSYAAVIWLFVGLITGTLPALLRTAGEQGRNKSAVAAAVISFVVFFVGLTLLAKIESLHMQPSIFAWLVCGLLWALGIVIPGLNSSSFLIFMGLYQPLVAGISELAFSVLLPFGIGMLVVIFFLPPFINQLLERAHSLVFHALFGIVIASIIVIIPMDYIYKQGEIISCAICFVVGLVAALGIGVFNKHFSEPN